MNNFLKYILFFIFTTFWISLASVSMAQMIIPLEGELDGKDKKYKIVIDAKMLELAENYVYMLDELEFLSKYYSSYFSKWDNTFTYQCSAPLKSFLEEIQSGIYFKDLKRLSKDLSELQMKLQIPDSLQDTFKKQIKLNMLCDNLSKEIAIYRELYSKEIKDKLDKYDNLENLQLYLLNQQSKLEKNQEKAEIIEKIKENESELLESMENNIKRMKVNLSQLESVKKNIKISAPGIYIQSGDSLVRFRTPYMAKETLYVTIPGIVYSPELSDEIKVVSIPPAPLPSAPPVTITSKRSQYTIGPGEYWEVKNFKDSSGNISKDMPIYLFNPTGEITIEGWNKNYVRISSEITVSSDSEQKIKRFVKDINIQILEKDSKLYINTEIPKLTDTKTKITDSHIKIKIPNKNEFVCNSSQGSIIVNNLNNNFKSNSKNCRLGLSNIMGDIELVNSVGNVELRDITGNINIENYYGSIYASNSQGDFKIKNANHSIELMNCKGSGEIINSGQIIIFDHIGNLNLFNKKGNIELTHVEGDIFAEVSYSPITMMGIRGKVNISNSHALIKASNIIGAFTAKNNYSLIMVSDFTGLIDITNFGGQTVIEVPEQLYNDILINSKKGTVNIQVEPLSNMLFSAKTEGGIIKSDLPVKINRDGITYEINHSFGAADHNVTVNGTQTTILITE